MPAVADKQDPATRIRVLLDEARKLRESMTPGSTFAQDRILLRAWQAERLAQTYGDLLQDPRYCPATQFFLEDLYGPKDYAVRDEGVGKVIRSMTRLLPAEALEVLAMALELDVISERLDLKLAQELRSKQRELKAPLMISPTAFARAYRTCDNREARMQQIDLIVEIGEEVDRLTQKPMIETTLSLMRTPARLMGLGELQMFLERGFKAFRHMDGADEFLATIEDRERRIAEQLFAARSRPFDIGEAAGKRARRRTPICEENPVA